MNHPNLIGSTVTHDGKEMVVTQVYRDSEGNVTLIVLGPLDYLTNGNDRLELRGKVLHDFLNPPKVKP